ncbi:MAG: hypothetical protein IKE38_03575, partial [Erysipelotrichaceae bacterium]|nr:hypothetical protein [Erysipelotrichaceae bacterium]
MEEKVTCPCCGSVVPKARFCSECGYLFDKEMEVKIRSKTRSPQILGIINQPDIPEPVEEGTVPENKLPMPEEEGFSLLVDCCRRTL